MKSYVAMEDLKRNHVVEQLNKKGFTETDNLSYRELVYKLATKSEGSK